MAARNETSQRKTALMQDLREAQLRGEGARNESPISQRELSARYELSGRTVSLLLQQLMQEGVLYTVPRVGTFLGPPLVASPDLYLFVTPVSRQNYAWATNIGAMQAGFADQVAQIGGASYALSLEELNWHLKEGNLTGVAGIYLYNVSRPIELLEQCGASGVVFEEDNAYQDNELLIGTVDYDNEDGGIQATRHLMALGHRDIAFLGLHKAGHQANHQMGELSLSWSTLRQEGWSRVLQSAGQDIHTLSFLPVTTSPIAHESQRATAREVAVQMMDAISTRQITAVVAVNVLAAQGLVQAMQEASIPREDWPALVCFDDAPRGAASGISYLRLPWEKIGAEAAQLLWERRKTPDLKRPQRRLVKMNLVPSLTCRPDWALSGLAHQQVIQDSLPTPRTLVGVSDSVAG